MRWHIGEAGEQAVMTRWTTFAHSAWSAIGMNMEDANRMTTWQLFIQALGYMMLVDMGCVLLLGSVILWDEWREECERKELERPIRLER